MSGTGSIGSSKLTVKEKQPAFVAVMLPENRTVELASGQHVRAFAGDYLVTRGRLVVDVVGATKLKDRYEIVDPRSLQITGAERDRLEATTGVGSTRTAADLITAVERLAAISIGTIRVDFTPGQLEEIAYRAKKRGRSVEQELRAVVDRIKEDLFWRS
jgi:hypothetical protein